MKTAEVIKTMIGGTFSFRNEQYHIKDIKHHKEDTWQVFTDKKNMLCTSYQLKNDFTAFIPQKHSKNRELVVQNGKADKEIQYFQALTDIMMDNIKKVQSTPTYIHQAKSVNESVKNIIEIKKTQIEVIKLVKGK